MADAQNKCQRQNHQDCIITQVCFNQGCMYSRLSCYKCIDELHNSHRQKLVHLDYIYHFIQTKSRNQSQTPLQTQSPWQELTNVLNHLKDLVTLVEKKISKFEQGSGRIQQKCKIIQENYNIQIGQSQRRITLNNIQLNALAEDMLEFCDVKDCKFIEKQSDELELNYFSFVNNLLQVMRDIVSQFKIIPAKAKEIKESKNDYIDFRNLPDRRQFCGGHTSQVCAVAICNMKDLLVSGSLDGVVNLWNLNTYTVIKSYNNGGSVFDVALSKEGNLLAFGGGGDYSIRLIDITDLKKDTIISELTGHKQIVYRLKFSNDSNYLVSGSEQQNINESKQLIVYQIKPIIQQYFRFNSEGGISAIAINSDDTLLASNQVQCIKIWDFQKKKLLCQYIYKDNAINWGGICFSNDKRLLATSHGSGLIKLWGLQDVSKQLQFIRQFQLANNAIWTVLFSPCSKFIITICNQDGEIKVIDQQNGQLHKQFYFEKANNVFVGLAISKEMLAHGDGQIIILHKREQQQFQQFQ